MCGMSMLEGLWGKNTDKDTSREGASMLRRFHYCIILPYREDMHLRGEFYRPDRFSKSDQWFITYDKIVHRKCAHILDEKITFGKFGDTCIKTSLWSMAKSFLIASANCVSNYNHDTVCQWFRLNRNLHREHWVIGQVSKSFQIGLKLGHLVEKALMSIWYCAPNCNWF